MRLYIAEKPSLGRAIADVLPKPQKKGDGFITAANGDVVSWCIGHLLEQAEPHQYNEAFKKWNAADLPIVPAKWQLNPKSNTRKQYSALRKLIKQADQLVHAGDPDREGQLLVDEVINHSGIATAKKQTVLRLLINDMNPTAVSRALGQLKSNREFIPLATSALARSRADWLYGINMTRAFTLAGQRAGFNGVLSVGRVQTPVLGLVVRRDREIENFVAVPFYEVWANISCRCGSQGSQFFLAKWQPGEACQQYQDSDGRVLSKPLAEKVAHSVRGQTGKVESYSSKKKSEPAPLPYNLSALQIDAARRFGLSAQQVLSSCQDLYERHKLLTYPRSDCRYLPAEQKALAHDVVRAIGQSCSNLRDSTSGVDLGIKSRAWNDAKVGAHHAIIPTAKAVDTSKLSRAEAQIYELVARQYLAQFYSQHIYLEVKVAVRIQSGLFTASSRKSLEMGWKNLFPKRDEKNVSELSKQTIPTLKKGEPIDCTDAEVRDKLTQPPLPFTDASLLAAMTGISRFVKDQDIRKVLRDTDGLGTEATRAGIIELLFRREFLNRSGKNIISTEAGRALIECLPDSASLPDMTAQWERHLEAISQREASYASFMEPLESLLDSLVSMGATADVGSFQGLKAAGSGKGANKGRRKSSAKKSYVGSYVRNGKATLKSKSDKANPEKAKAKKTRTAKPKTRKIGGGAA
ncbi:MAG: DNA topoisomerase III [Pseudomonadales bacterium]